MRMRGLLVVALVAAAAAFPLAATAAHTRHVHAHLGLVPLQKSRLGSAGASLAIQHDSGSVPNAQSEVPGFGRLGGYRLDYGVPYSGGAGVTSIETQVEQFRTPAGGKKALTFWKFDDRLQGALYQQIGVAGSAHLLKVRHAGSGHFAYLTAMQIPNADPIYGVDEVATSGSFILHATVTAGTESTAEKLAPALTAKLIRRLQQLLAGHLHGKPAHAPPLPQPGPPPGGPDLSTLVVGPSDLSGQATVTDQGYVPEDPALLSEYAIDIQPAGPFRELSQSIGWFANANEATWEGTLESGLVFKAGFLQVTPVDLTGVGDNAQGAIFPGTDLSGNPDSEALVLMWQGQAFDIALLESPTTIQASDVQSLAQSMANHLNAGLAGVSTQAPTTWTSQRLSRSRSSSMKSTRCHVPSWSSPSRTGTDSPAVPSSIAMQWEWPLPWSMSSGQMFSVRRSQSSCA
jgi:hypothetical protein